MADTVEELLVKISADVSELKEGMTEGAGHVRKAAADVEHSNEAMAASFESVKHHVEQLRTAFQTLVAGEMVELIKRNLEYGESLESTSKVLGINTDQLQEWHYVAAAAGVGAEAMDAGLRRLSISLGKAAEGGAEASKIFARLRLDPAQFKDTNDAMEKTLAALAEMPSSAERSAAAMEIFGRQAGPKMAELAAQGVSGIDALRQAAHNVGAVMDEETIKSAAAASEQLGELGLVLKSQVATVLTNLGPILVDITALIAFMVKGWAELFGLMKEGIPTVREFTKEHEKLARLLPVPFRVALEAAEGYEKVLDRIKGKTADVKPRAVAEASTTTSSNPVDTAATTAAKEKAAKIADEIEDARLEHTQRVLEEEKKSSEETTKRLLEIRAKLAEDRASIIASEKSYSTAAENKELAFMKEAMNARIKLVQQEAENKVKAMKKQGFDPATLAKEEAKVRQAAELQQTAIKEKGEKDRTDIQKKYADRRIKDALEEYRREDVDRKKSDDIIRKDQQDAQDKLIESIGINAEDFKKLGDLQVATAAQNYDTIASLAGSLTETLGAHSKRAFETHKALAIADTLIHTYKLIAGAASDTGGDVVTRIAAGVAAAAFGFAQVQKISSTHFGGGGGGGGSVGAGGGTSPAAVAAASGRSSGPNTYISLPAGQNFYSGDFIRELIQQINQAQGDGARIQVVS